MSGLLIIIIISSSSSSSTGMYQFTRTEQKIVRQQWRSQVTPEL